MATPRKHWFKVADSILWEGWTDAELATMVRLSAYLNTRWARDGMNPQEAGRAFLPLEACRLIARRTHRADCERALRALGARLTLSIVVVEGGIEIEWPKWPTFQGIQTRESPESRPRVSPSDSDSKTDSKTVSKTEEKKPEPPAPRSAPVSRPKGKRPCPDELEPEAIDRITAWASLNGIAADRLGPAWECFRDWARSGDKRQADWEAGFRNALRKGWVLERRNVNGSGEAESPAQAKVRRSKEAAARVIQMLDRKPNNGGMIA